jgi:hypothetical protein
MALAVDGEIQKVVIKLIAPGHSREAAERIWAAWEPHISPLLGHPLATGTMAMDTHGPDLYTLVVPYGEASQGGD